MFACCHAAPQGHVSLILSTALSTTSLVSLHDVGVGKKRGRASPQGIQSHGRVLSLPSAREFGARARAYTHTPLQDEEGGYGARRVDGESRDKVGCVC